MNNYVVYMHINRANGKRYVGISSNPLARWANGRGYYKNKHFADAIEKYGWNNFDHLILYAELSKEDACEIEQHLIKKYKTQDKRFGYNITSGGAEKKPVLCVETGEVFSCIKEAANQTGINKKQISNCCRGVPHYNTAGGYTWRFAKVG